MGKLFRRRALGVLALVIASALAVWACSAPVKVGVEADALGVGLKVSIDSAGNAVAEVTGSLAPGTCLQITFTGADGAEIQTVVLSVPGHCQIPPGAVQQVFEIVDCPPPPPGGSAAPTGPAPLPLAPVAPAPRWREVVAFPIAMQTGTLHGTFCHARVWCTPAQSACALLQPVLAAGPGFSVPATIDVRLLADSIDTSTGAILRIAAREPIGELRLDWNGLVGFGDLGSGVNAIPRALGNGWTSVECFIGDADANDGVGDWNRATVTLRTRTQLQSAVYSLAVQNLAF